MSVDVEKMKKKKAELDQKSGGGQFWVPAEGRNIIRVCPPQGKKDEFYHEFYTHWLPQAKRAFICLNPPNGKGKGKCFLCQQVSKDKGLKPRPRFLLNIVDRRDENAGVQLFNSGITIVRELLGVITDPEWGDITDPETGTDIILDREGTGQNTSYTVRMRRNPSELDEKFLEQLHDLDNVLQENTYQEQKAAYLGDASEEEELDEEDEESGSPPEDEQPKCYGRYNSKSNRCKKCEYNFECELDSAPEDEDSIEDEKEDSAEDEEEPSQEKSRHSKSKKKLIPRRKK